MFDLETPPPPLDSDALDRLRQTFASEGPLHAADRLCAELRAAGDYAALFYALLMKKRIELGVSPFPTGPAADLPAHTHEAYEDAIRAAGREVGQLFLDRGEYARAYSYFHMLGETQPVYDAIERYNLSSDDDCQPVVEVALHHGVHPTKGFDIVLERYGICSAITTVSSVDLSKKPEVFAHCVRRLVRSLYDQLQERLRNDIVARGEADPGPVGVAKLLEGREHLTADDAYHIDTSHLSSVVQMAMQLSPCEELNLARELCLYGARLGPAYQSAGDPPFEGAYKDYLKYFDVLIGDRRDEGLAHFRAKVDQLGDDDSPYPAEVLVSLLVKVERLPEALAVAKKHLARVPDQHLSCPGVYELCHRAGDFAAMADVARERQDGVQMLAALAKKSEKN